MNDVIMERTPLVIAAVSEKNQAIKDRDQARAERASGH
ncbi:hypothetical protein DesyoDRAFT_0184 [Desulfosporosinus youngiae DSM 17734]|uniref:Uncharacterized protein n=1 Tax=Desulfosporosinus youngiae DSM 17734 TaxID=768710 RepID=H5Y113_9FIRM|nr:hypothetical protein DesyoDRAFT_0184 [Desulfosporosinus youngiae DSM 17734]